MNFQQEKAEKKKQEKSKENNNNNNRAREDVVVADDGGVRIAAYSEAWRRGFTTALMNDCIQRAKLSAEQCKAWLDYMKDVGWAFSTGAAVTPKNCLRSMRMWKKVDERLAAGNAGNGRGSAGDANAKENEYERIKRLEALRRVEMAAKPESWELCAERCAMFRKGKCSMGRKIPPQLRERPVAPEECGQFKAKEVR